MMTRQEGEFCNKRCPKCGATLLKNERGDEWCSSPGCEYLSKGLHEKEKRLLEFIRRLKYGEVTIKVQDGLPVMVERATNVLYEPSNWTSQKPFP